MTAAAANIPTRTIFPSPGGVHPPDNKAQSLALALASLTPPPQVVLPLNQHIGGRAEAVVNVGDKVLAGQIVASAKGFISANVHASVSGTVSAIEARPIAHPSGMEDLCIVIDNDFNAQWCEIIPCANYRQVHAIELVDRIQAAGVVGMGGAGFPTAVKLQSQDKINTLIINATECEPYITADDMLMRTDSHTIVAAIELLDYLLEHPQSILIAIEDNKPEAIAAMTAAVEKSGNDRVEVAVLPTKYPSGGEKQLIQMLTGHELASGQLPASLGIVCQNVATAVAAYQAVVKGQPLINRIVTVAGNALRRQQNLIIPIGTPIEFVLAQQGLQTKQLSRLIMGGPMMGFTLNDYQVPVVKTTNCILALDHQEAPPPQPATACIRCGMCAEACPASLLPQQLYWYARAQDHEKLNGYHLFDCIECGACSYACPSHIPLVQYYRAAKAEIRQAELDKHHSDRARQRFEFHKQRIEEEKLARAEAKRIAAEKAKQRQQEKAALKQVDKQSQAKAEGQVGAGHDDGEIERVQRHLAGAADRLQKLQSKLAVINETAPEQVPALQARIKAAELKHNNLASKLTQLQQPSDTNKCSAISEDEAKTSAASSQSAKLQPANANDDTKTLSTSQRQLAQWQQQLQDIQADIVAQQNSSDENIDALKLSEKILLNKIASAKVSAADAQEADAPNSSEASLDPIQRAMEAAMAKLNANNNKDKT